MIVPRVARVAMESILPHGQNREPNIHANVRPDDAANASAMNSLQ